MNAAESEFQTIYAAVSHIISPIYLVGGSVRDYVLGRPCTDYDFATPLEPEKVEAAIRAAGMHLFLVGKRFGTLGMRLNGRSVEITTFRAETYSRGSRKPFVTYTHSLEQDLSRRDFTINAMAWQPGRLVDLFNGQEDLREGIVRAVGQPGERFQEDPLRMLRAARFSAQLGFRIEEQTLQSISENAQHILMVSHERWTQELDTLLLSKQPSCGLQVLADTRLLACMLPELAVIKMHTHFWQSVLKEVDTAPAEIVARWAALFRIIGKPAEETLYPLIGREMVVKIGKYLHWPDQRTKLVAHLVSEAGQFVQ